ncbi:MAG: RluA family pseudouridine synthase [Chitinispirillales bacterium]|jgi:23S rRNA pseudouridine1911/1915/1917 synthase|nr:RluA family pseudouridine synthase [Chitinispirillales bacterium]
MNYVVDNSNDGRRLDVYLSDILTGVSRTRVQKIIEDGLVSINGNIIVKKNVIVNLNDAIDVDELSIRSSSQVNPPEPQNIALDIIYEDEYLAVINKPAGLVVHPGNAHRDGTLVNALLYRFGANVSSGSDVWRPGIVHRLDKDTSGAIMIAKTDAAHTALANLFAARAITKVYTGFCVGKRPLIHELIDLPLAVSRNDPTKRAVDKTRGASALTEYRLIKYQCGISAIEFTLHTGRTHQIRVHCGYKGFPIVRDDLYGGHQDRIQTIAPMERPFAHGIFKCFSRHALHARLLEFIHPFTNENMEIIAPYPMDFCMAFRRCF